MSKGRASPGVGHNGNLPEHGEIRAAMALEILFQEEKKKLNEKHKRARKGLEGKGIILAKLDDQVKRRDDTEQEVEQRFRTDWHYAGATHPGLSEQFDLFLPKKSAPEKRAALFHIGLMAALQGKEQTIVPTWSDDDRNQYLEGYGEGTAKREAARLGAFAEALANPGQVIDGTTGKVSAGKGPDKKAKAAKEAAAVGEQARADFNAEPPGEILQPDWEGFSDNPREWTEAQAAVFDGWLTAVPDGAVVRIAHKGVQVAWNEAMGVEQPTPKVEGDEGFEATPEELAAQATRTSVQEQRTAEEEAAENAPPPNPRKRRLPGESTPE